MHNASHSRVRALCKQVVGVLAFSVLEVNKSKGILFLRACSNSKGVFCTDIIHDQKHSCIKGSMQFSGLYAK